MSTGYSKKKNRRSPPSGASSDRRYSAYRIVSPARPQKSLT
jgi:hypothetical protein